MSGMLIVNADDYGRTQGVSAGIRYAHLHGLVSTTTVMINLPGATDQVRVALADTPDLGIGVHLNLTVGVPCAPAETIPSLLNTQGKFHRRADIFMDPNRLNPNEVDIEWRAQIDALLSTGASLDHIDSHNHVAVIHPHIWDIHLGIAESYQCGVRPPYPSDVSETDMRAAYPQASIAFARETAMDRLKASGIPHPDHFLASFFGASATLDYLLWILDTRAEDDCELMCHPGYVEPALIAASGYAKEREIELEALTHADALRKTKQSGLRLCTYRDAWKPS